MKKALITALAITLQTSCALAGVPLRFDADVRSTSTFQASAYRGETLDIRARLLDGAHPLPVPAGAEAAMLWQTNGMGTAWWSVPATVSTSGVVEATWTPTNDVGAASYRVFLGVAADGRNWRANLLLRLIDAPGASPNELEPPIQSIDFSLVEVSNAPWLTEEADPTVPAWAKAETPPLTEESDPVWGAEKGGYATTNDLGSAAFVDAPRKYALDATNIVGITIQPLTTSDWEANYIGGIAISHPDYGSVSLSFPDDFTETESGWFGSVEMTKTAPRQLPRYLGSVLITNLVFGAELSTMTSSAVECSMDCVADWQGDSDNIHFEFYARSDRHDGWMSVGEAADLSASRAAVAATNYTDAAVADLKSQVETGWWTEWDIDVTFSGPFAGYGDWRIRRVDGNWRLECRLGTPGEWILENTSDAGESATRLEWDDFVDQGIVRVAATRHRVAGPMEGYVLQSKKEHHADSATNIVWMNVYSNGWVFLRAYTNELSEAY